LLLGACGVGKTQFLNTFLGKRFDKKIEATNGVDISSTYIHVGPKVVKLQLIDTSGDPALLPIIKSYYTTVKAAILFYDLRNKATYDYIATVMKELPTSQGLTKLIVGTKSDGSKNLRCSATIEAYAKRHQASVFEASARKKMNVSEIVYLAVRKALGVD
jgi:small GTP-binding protein